MRAAMLAVNLIASPHVLAQLPELNASESAIRAAVRKLTVGDGRVGEAGRPRALSTRQEELFAAWIEAEIAANRPPTKELCLRKATELRRGDVQHGDKLLALDIKAVQIGWLKSFLQRHPNYNIKPARQLEAVLSFFLKNAHHHNHTHRYNAFLSSSFIVFHHTGTF
jgi:hypothetical protein